MSNLQASPRITSVRTSLSQNLPVNPVAPIAEARRSSSLRMAAKEPVTGYYAGVVGRPQSMGRGVVSVSKGSGNHMIAYILWFVVVFLISWVLLYAFGPSFVITEDEVNQGKVILWSAVISFLVVGIVSIVYTENRGGKKFSFNLNA